MSSTTENAFKSALQQAVFSCAASLDALKASRTQPPEILKDNPTPADVRSDFLSILSLLYARSTSLTLVLKAGPESISAAREPLTEIARDVARLAHCAGAFSVSGPTIRAEATWGAEEVIESIQTYLVGFARASATGTPSDPKALMLRVGTIHNVIDRTKGSLSENNRAAVAKRWQANASHLDDAVREIKEMIEESESGAMEEKDDFDDGWGEIMDGPGGKLAPNEIEAAKKVMLLLRMVALLHKRIMSRLIVPSTDANTPVLDIESLLALSASLAAGSDDIAASLWSPQDMQQIISQAKSVQDRVHAFLEPLASSGLFPASVGERSTEGNSSSQTTNKDAEWFKMCFDQIDKAVRSVTVNS
ncbi:hypothetical protein FRC08_017795 [Ceratobasidium sp. 394]|nr:hypothetical protein FRC08_017795 [Ceratobasidium sp. 394]